MSRASQLLVVAGSLIMIAGAVAISFAEPAEGEQSSWKQAVDRECLRYSLDRERVGAILEGRDPRSADKVSRNWWEWLIAAAAIGMFLWLGAGATRQPIAVNIFWMVLLIAATLVLLIVCGTLLWKRTRFS